MKREFRFRPFTSNLFVLLGILFIISAGFFYFVRPMGIDISFWMFLIAILFIIFGMYRIFTFYAYIGEYALSINSNFLIPRRSIPWREISDIELEDNGIIIVYRSAGRAITFYISKSKIEKNQWNTFVDNIREQWKEGSKSTAIQ